MIVRVHPNFPDYEIRDDGSVKRIRTTIRSKAGTQIMGRIVCSGYRQFKLVNKDGKRVEIRAGRLIAETFLGPPPTSAHQAAHNDGNKTNDRLSNIRWATPKENNADKLLHGTHQRGERAGNSILTEEAVHEIRRRYTGKRGEIKKLAWEFGVYYTAVSKVIHGVSWAHVPPGRSALDRRNA